MRKKSQSVSPTRWQRLIGALVALVFVAAVGAAHSHDVPLTKQIGETGSEYSVSDAGLLTALHTPGLVPSISPPRPLWLLVQSTVYLPVEPTSPSNYVRPPPFAS